MYAILLWKNTLVFKINFSFRPICQKKSIVFTKYPEKYTTSFLICPYMPSGKLMRAEKQMISIILK